MVRAFTSRLLLAALVVAGCKKEAKVTAPLPSKPPAMRAAASFVHCVEAGTTACAESNVDYTGWDAFYLLTWLSEGSPTSILRALPRELERHADPLEVQARFVDQIERYALDVRGAECEPTEMFEFGPLIDTAAQRAADRMTRFGLMAGGMGDVLQGLATQAHQGLDGGHMVRMECTYQPFRLYVGSAERDGAYEIVGMATLLPAAFDSKGVTPTMVDVRLESRALGLQGAQGTVMTGTVDRWLPFPVEDF